VAATARTIGVHRTQLRRLLERHAISAPADNVDWKELDLQQLYAQFDGDSLDNNPGQKDLYEEALHGQRKANDMLVLIRTFAHANDRTASGGA